jgi:hypothetical protein
VKNATKFWICEKVKDFLIVDATWGSGAEHRECMFHLVTNFKKRYHGKVFNDHLWAATYSWNPYLFAKHWLAMENAKPTATNWLRKTHKKLWTRSQFKTICKVN